MTRARAFTLIELLAATAISAMLMIGVLGVVTDLGELAAGVSPEGRSATPVTDDPVSAWVRLLREDLEQARGVEETSGGVMLTGQLALGRDRRDRTHRPACVRYRVETIAGRRWVVRQQEALDVRTNDNVQRDLVLSGVQRFELIARLPQTELAASDGDEEATEKRKNEPNVPAAVAWRLRLWMDGEARPAFDEIVAVRPGGGR